VTAISANRDRGWFDGWGRARALIEVHIELPGGAITPRMVQLLDRIFQSGSIRQAALSKGMSYRTAWIMVQEVEKIVGKSIIQRRAGGASGGGSRLSEAGQRLLRSCRRIETLANRATKRELKNLSAVTNKKIRRRS